jgi:hypothetical protein
MSFETENDEVGETIPTASEQCDRILGELKDGGEKFRAEHPELVNKLATLLKGVHRGTHVYVKNTYHRFRVCDVIACLDGLGYVVEPVNSMVQNDYLPFRIRWCRDNTLEGDQLS